MSIFSHFFDLNQSYFYAQEFFKVRAFICPNFCLNFLRFSPIFCVMFMENNPVYAVITFLVIPTHKSLKNCTIRILATFLATFFKLHSFIFFCQKEIVKFSPGKKWNKKPPNFFRPKVCWCEGKQVKRASRAVFNSFLG